MNSRKILVVDDEQNIRDIISEFLGDLGYEVSVAVDGVDALEKVEYTKYSLYIIDIYMPRMGGLELIARLKEIQPLAVIIVTTGFSSIDVAIRAIRTGAYHYLTKPIQPEELIKVVDSGLAHVTDLGDAGSDREEAQTSVIKSSELSLGSDGVANSDTVSFSMVLNTHYHSSGLDWQDIRLAQINADLSPYQLFRSLVWDSAQYDEHEEQDPNLVNIDSSILIGIGNKQIFLRDNQGIIRILNLRDKVLGGYLYSIDQRDNKAVFKVDKYGLEENQVLYLTKEN